MADNGIPAVPSILEMLGTINQNRQRMETDESFLKSLTDPHPSGNPISIGRRIPTPDKIVELQLKGVSDNAQKWLTNTVTPKKNFKEEALKPQAVQRYKNSMQKVIAEDRQAKGMALVDESEAIATVQALGTGAYTNGVTARKGKILRVAKELDSDRLALAAAVDALPVSTDGEREAKMIANKRGQQAIGNKRRGITS